MQKEKVYKFDKKILDKIMLKFNSTFEQIEKTYDFKHIMSADYPILKDILLRSIIIRTIGLIRNELASIADILNTSEGYTKFTAISINDDEILPNIEFVKKLNDKVISISEDKLDEVINISLFPIDFVYFIFSSNNTAILDKLREEKWKKIIPDYIPKTLSKKEKFILKIQSALWDLQPEERHKANVIKKIGMADSTFNNHLTDHNISYFKGSKKFIDNSTKLDIMFYKRENWIDPKNLIE